MGKAKPVYPDGLEPWLPRDAFRTAVACRETTQAPRAHQLAMGTRRTVHLPGPSRFRNPHGMIAALSPLAGRLLCPSYSMSTPP